jgi:hypothetical protein
LRISDGNARNTKLDNNTNSKESPNKVINKDSLDSKDRDTSPIEITGPRESSANDTYEPTDRSVP